MSPRQCPRCKEPWEETETIYEFFLNKYKNKERALEAAKCYGCTPETPKHFGKNVHGIEIQGKYDGISYWECQCCKTTFDRFTMEIVKKSSYDIGDTVKDKI